MSAKNLARALLAPALFLHTLAAAGSTDAIPDIRAPGAFFQPRAGEQRAAAIPGDLVRVSARLTAAERHDLGPLSAAERKRLADPEPQFVERVKIGIARDLGEAVVLSGLPGGLAAGTERAHSGGIARREADRRLSWTTAFVSPGAAAVRLYIQEAALPAGGRLYVYSERGEVHGPYSFEGGVPAGGFWSHTVAGEQVYLEVQLAEPSGSASICRLVVSSVGHLTGAASGLSAEATLAAQDTSCFQDVACVSSTDFPLIASAKHSVASLLFADAGFMYLCSGGLIAAIGDISTPYLLTANHCFDNQASATSLQATWNFINTGCGQTFPNESTFPSTLGATLLATGAASDFTLVRLSQNPPAGAFLLGWTTQEVSTANGLKIYRLSHPAPPPPAPPPNGNAYPEHFTRQFIVGSPAGTCTGAAQGNFLYSTQDLGGTAEGSSGSPVYLADGSIVGQLLGKCGSNTGNACDVASNYIVDGAFRTSYPALAQWLNPQSTGACTPSATVLCLSNNRFRVSASWESATASGVGTAVPLTSDTGFFWFFSNTNVEVVAKVLNACTVNNQYWVFSGGLTNVRVTLSVTDTQNGTVRTYINTQGTAFQPIQDTTAFATCP
ncbi:MAG: trypsin-like peptidase domain-containing protein [Thermoanaerobaculia bacterium]